MGGGVMKEECAFLKKRTKKLLSIAGITQSTCLDRRLEATSRFSIFSILAQAATGQTGWKPQWRTPEPKAAYDALIVGGGGHGLACAYYLAKNHGLTNIAVIEKNLVGSGNV